MGSTTSQCAQYKQHTESIESEPQIELQTPEEILLCKINKDMKICNFNSRPPYYTYDELANFTEIYCLNLEVFKLISKEMIPNLIKINIYSSIMISKTNIGYIPEQITHLYFANNGYEGTCLFDNLPRNIQHLELPRYYNEQLDNLPLGLRYLKLGDYLNHPLDNLPENLETLILGSYYNHSLDNLPRGLKSIFIPGDFLHTLNNLPDSIEHIQIGNINQINSQSISPTIMMRIDKLPKKIITIKCAHNIKLFSVNFHPLSIIDPKDL
jgi:hypothetical protein